VDSATYPFRLKLNSSTEGRPRSAAPTAYAFFLILQQSPFAPCFFASCFPSCFILHECSQHSLCVIRLFLAVFGFHFARITHAAASRVFCVGTRRAVFHRTRPAVATTRFHCATRFCLLLVTLSGGLCYPCCKCDQQQAEKHYQDSSLSGFHFSSPVSKVVYRAPVHTPAAFRLSQTNVFSRQVSKSGKHNNEDG